jgi:toxin ParE1/3/4
MTRCWLCAGERVRIRWLRRAILDLDQVEAFVARDNPVAATALVVEIVQAVSLLGEQPGLGRSGRVPQTRELVVPGTPYLVPYRVVEGTVQILRVYHGARRWPVRL